MSKTYTFTEAEMLRHDQLIQAKAYEDAATAIDTMTQMSGFDEGDDAIEIETPPEYKLVVGLNLLRAMAHKLRTGGIYIGEYQPRHEDKS